MLPLNLTYLHCLLHSFFEHLFNLYLYILNIYADMYLLIKFYIYLHLYVEYHA